MTSSIELSKIIQSLQRLRANTNIPVDFHSQVSLTDSLLRNDKTGFVNSILDFQINCADVPYEIETKNEALDNVLNKWKTVFLNGNVSPDVPRGLRELSSQYFKERWRSSFIVLRVRWERISLGKSTYELPTKMWFVDGSSVIVRGEKGKINKREYFIGNTYGTKLVDTAKESVIIRKPYSAWYEDYPVPYLVRKGTLFNALLKEAIITKQADVIESVIPYLLLLKSGSDKMAELEQLADEESLKALKEELIKAKESHDITGSLGSLIASIGHDVNFEHLMPDFLKIFNPDITKACDKNILASLGMIEMESFSKKREDALLNPKLLVEEIKDAILDWGLIIEEVVYQIIEKNRVNGVDNLKTNVRVIPGSPKAFLTEGSKALYNILYSRGLISKQTTIETVGDFDWEVEKERRRKETGEGLDEKMQAPIVQRQEQNKTNNTVSPNSDENNQNPKNESTKDKKKEASLKTVDDLPDSVKTMPVPAQILFVKTYNTALDQGHDEEEAFKFSSSVIRTQYKKDEDNAWVKKSKEEVESSFRETNSEDLIKMKKLDILAKQEKLLNKLLKEKQNENV